MKHLNTILFIVTLIYSAELHAQETLPATGGDASGSGGSSSFTVGQVAYTANTGSNGSLTQGVQQPYEIYVLVGIEKAEIDLELKAYPNPTDKVLTLSIGNYHDEQLSYEVYDGQGKAIESKKIGSSSTIIEMEALPKGIYFLKVIGENQALKTFKIVKN